MIPFAAIIGFVGFLIMAEPDLGTAVTITVIGGGMFFVAGAALKHILVMAVSGAGVLFAIIGIFGYGLDRFTQFVSAESNPEGGGFQVLQLLIALGSGGLTGVGLGESRQKFFYVPSAHTDGVFAIIGEEVGFLGAGLILLLFVFLIYRGLRIAQKAPDQFGTLLAVGIVIWLATQAFFNIGGGHAQHSPHGNPAALHLVRQLRPHLDARGRGHPSQRVALFDRAERAQARRGASETAARLRAPPRTP